MLDLELCEEAGMALDNQVCLWAVSFQVKIFHAYLETRYLGEQKKNIEVTKPFPKNYVDCH